MSSNVGLSTPRGSGTSGYVQRNLSLLKPRDHYSPYAKDSDQPHRQRNPDQQILDHDRLREIEVKVFDLRDKLEEEEVDEDEIETQCNELRERLMNEKSKKGGIAGGKGDGEGRKQFKTHQVHEQAEAKILESEKLRKALGISQDYEDGAHWRKKDERMRESSAGEKR